MNGTHRPEGIFIAIGGGQPGKAGAELAPESLSRVAPALARAMGLRWTPGEGEDESGGVAYTREENEMVAARLRALGYLD